MNHLRGQELVTLSSSSLSRSSSMSLLEGARVLAFYFSAHWCPPCRQFTPRLADAHRARRDARAARVVFVSSDRSESEMLEYMRQMHDNWPAIPPNNPLSETLKRVYGVRGIPALIVVNAGDGSVISAEGRQDVLSQGASAFDSWIALASNPTDVSVVSLLKENPPEVMNEAVNILVKLISNVLKDPQSLKYRSVRLSNPIIESKLLSAHGAFEILFSVGFEECDDSLMLPFSANLAVLEDFKAAIEGIMKTKSESSIGSGSNGGNSNNSERRNEKSSSAAQLVESEEIGSKIDFKPFTWTLTEKEVKDKEFCLEYDIIKDVYSRKSNEAESVPGWEKGAKVCENVERKFENDSGFFYLARTKGSAKATLGWELDLSDSNLSVKSIELLVSSQVFENGRVVWQLCGNSICLLPSSGKVLQSDALAGAKKIQLTASMSGGKDDVAWKHTQIFRTQDKEGCQLRMRVLLKDE